MKASAMLGIPLGMSQPDVNPVYVPGVDLGVPRPNYVSDLQFVESPNRHRRGLGRRLAGFDKTLQTLGARAAKAGQKLARPPIFPHIAYLAPDEVRTYMRRNDPIGERSLRFAVQEMKFVSSTEVAEVPYSVHVVEDAVVARILHESWAENSEITKVRKCFSFLEVPAMLADVGFSEVPLAGTGDIVPDFAERIEDINKYDLTLTVGRLTVFRY
jgi:hypothetical protein